jgi:hypothetical protein
MEPGRNEPSLEQQGPLSVLLSFGRLVGFAALVTPALLAIAAVVLLPAYAQMQQAQYERACEQALTTEMLALRAANERVLAEGPDSRTLTKRYMLTQTALAPKDERVIPTGAATPLPPSIVTPALQPRPQPPQGWVQHYAAKVEDPPTRRGILLLALGAIVTAMFLFSPPDKYRGAEQPQA